MQGFGLPPDTRSLFCLFISPPTAYGTDCRRASGPSNKRTSDTRGAIQPPSLVQRRSTTHTLPTIYPLPHSLAVYTLHPHQMSNSQGWENGGSRSPSTPGEPSKLLLSSAALAITPFLPFFSSKPLYTHGSSESRIDFLATPYPDMMLEIAPLPTPSSPLPEAWPMPLAAKALA